MHGPSSILHIFEVEDNYLAENVKGMLSVVFAYLGSCR